MEVTKVFPNVLYVHTTENIMKKPKQTIQEIKSHLQIISLLISSSELINDQKESTLNNLESLSEICDDKSLLNEKNLISGLSNLFWSYDKMRIYFLGAREQFQIFYKSYNALLQLRNDLGLYFQKGLSY